MGKAMLSTFFVSSETCRSHIQQTVAQGEERVTAVSGEGGEVQARVHMLAHGFARKLRHPHPYCGDHGDVVIAHTRHPRVGLTAAVSDELQHGRLIHRQLRQKLLIALDDVGIAAGVDNELVEWHVGLSHARNVALNDAVLESLCQR